MGISVITPPSAFPATLEQAKGQCRVDTTDEDAFINDLLADATDHAEHYLRRAIMTQTLRMTVDRFSDTIMIARGPLQSVISMTYADPDGEQQTVDPGIYTIDKETSPGWIVRNADRAWPEAIDAVNAVSITYVAGFALVPPSIRRAVLMLVAHWYDNRPAATDKAATELPFGVTSLLGPFRRMLV